MIRYFPFDLSCLCVKYSTLSHVHISSHKQYFTAVRPIYYAQKTQILISGRGLAIS